MDISRIGKMMGAYKVNATKKVSKTTDVTKTETEGIQVSKSAQDFQTAYKAAMKAPEVREEKLAEVKQREKDITPEDIAEKMMNSNVTRRL